jgi:uncharacterized protein YodC (DUF2158 family)
MKTRTKKTTEVEAKTKKIQAGNVVSLRSDTERHRMMTVEYVGQDGASCVWFDGIGSFKRENIGECALVVVTIT